MTASYSADLRLASAVVTTLASVEDELDEVVVDLRWRLARLHGTWGGLSAASHLETHDRWQSAYDEMHAALATMRRAIHTARENYSAAATANRELWEQVR